MRFDSVRELKQDVLESIVIPFAARAGPHDAPARARRAVVGEGVHHVDTLAVGARPLHVIPQMQRSLALGITRSGREYQLAVRVQRQALMGPGLLQAIAARAHGEIDVRYIGRIEKRTRTRVPVPAMVSPGGGAWYRGNTRPLLIGASVGHVAVTAGTTGAFVTCGSTTHLLSNNHVLANENNAAQGDPILQRATLDGGRGDQDCIGHLSRWVTLRGDRTNTVDAALAELSPGVEIDAVRLRGIRSGGDGSLCLASAASLEPEETVYKIGRTTGVTRGRVTTVALDNVVVGYDMGNLRFDGQVEIEGADADPFSDGGDSGSLILDEGLGGAALLFAGSDFGGQNGLGLTYATPLRNVLDALEANLLC